MSLSRWQTSTSTFIWSEVGVLSTRSKTDSWWSEKSKDEWKLNETWELTSQLSLTQSDHSTGNAVLSEGYKCIVHVFIIWKWGILIVCYHRSIEMFPVNTIFTMTGPGSVTPEYCHVTRVIPRGNFRFWWHPHQRGPIVCVYHYHVNWNFSLFSLLLIRNDKLERMFRNSNL